MPFVGYLLLWRRPLEEATKLGRGAVTILWWHVLYNISTPFFLRMTQSTLSQPPLVLVALLGTEHSVNGNYSSFRRDLGIYLKTIGDDAKVIKTFTFVCLVETEVHPGWFSSFWSRCVGIPSFGTYDIFHATSTCRGNSYCHSLHRGCLLYTSDAADE